MKDIICAEVKSSGIITLTISGEVGEEDIGELRTKLAEISALIEEQFRKTNKKVQIIIDISGFAGEYHQDAIRLMVNFAKQNRLFVDKTASFGGTFKARIAGEVVAGLAVRDNIKLFDTEEKAMKWLQE